MLSDLDDTNAVDLDRPSTEDLDLLVEAESSEPVGIRVEAVLEGFDDSVAAAVLQDPPPGGGGCSRTQEPGLTRHQFLLIHAFILGYHKRQ